VTEEQARSRLALLAVAHEVVLGPRGIAAEMTMEAEAYRALVKSRELLGTLVPELTEIVKTGSPAGVTYAVALLAELDHDVESFVAAYADDRRELTIYPGGCKFSRVWLAEAVRQVSGDEYWRHPAREAPTMSAEVRDRHLQALRKAKWLELPSQEIIYRRGWSNPPKHDIDGAWVHDLLALYSLPAKERIGLADTFVELATAPSPTLVGPMYGVALLRSADRARAEATLASFATREGRVRVHEQKHGVWDFVRVLGGPAYRVRKRPLAEVVELVRTWPR
jgi:hypothetical protein